MMIRTDIPKNASGIYIIYSRSTNKCYIGCASNLHQRKITHFWRLNRGLHASLKLQEVYDETLYKYEGDLIFGILEFCPIKNLFDRERYYHVTLQPELNMYIKKYPSCFDVPQKKKKQQKLKITRIDHKLFTIQYEKYPYILKSF